MKPAKPEPIPITMRKAKPMYVQGLVARDSPRFPKKDDLGGGFFGPWVSICQEVEYRQTRDYLKDKY